MSEPANQVDPGQAGAIQTALQRLVADGRFQGFILAVIVANAATLGLQTYSGIRADIGGLLETLDSVFLGIFCVEIGLRIAAFGARPDRYFRDGWNIFDFVVVAAAFAPGLRENATLLRLVRLLRVVRIVSVLPDLRILIRGMVASLRPIGSMAALAMLLMYVYGIVGWIIFRDDDPERWGTVGEAMLTLFVVMTLESWPDIMGVVREVHPAAWIFFVSYVLIASFLLINVLIAILITAIEEARAEHRREDARERVKAAHELDEADQQAVVGSSLVAVEDRVAAIRSALDDLEAELELTRPVAQRMASKARLKP